MATGKRPWSEFESSVQVFFAVGEGRTPKVAKNVPGDVKDFLAKTIIVKPALRSSAKDLLKDELLTAYKGSLSDYQRSNNGGLSRGVFGRVHLYQHVSTDEQIMVKKTYFQPNETCEEYENLLVELKIMRKLSRFDHPNIIRYLFEHIDMDSGTFYIGMEYMTEGSLARKIKGNPLPKDNLRNYTHQILCGVKFLHEIHIVHQNITRK
ncbi:mitogen-activated protein kinase kinase kinase 2-like [Lineus longissimus]|uniref:mitogen-activated protein kinase kinase kinase 2-like n=1 Tax=Lineus longissimus TaxID=88925 RepID=UPI00315D45E5